MKNCTLFLLFTFVATQTMAKMVQDPFVANLNCVNGAEVINSFIVVNDLSLLDHSSNGFSVIGTLVKIKDNSPPDSKIVDGKKYYNNELNEWYESSCDQHKISVKLQEYVTLVCGEGSSLKKQDRFISPNSAMNFELPLTEGDFHECDNFTDKLPL